MNAGARNVPIDVIAHTGIENRRGELVEDGWTRVAEAWVSVEGQSGSTVEVGGLETATVTATMRGLFDDLDGVKPTMRVRWVDRGRIRIFEIESAVDVNEAHEEMRLTIREVSPANDDQAAAALPAEVGAA